MKCEKMPPGGQRTIGRHVVISLCAACTGCILRCAAPRLAGQLCLGAACTGCIPPMEQIRLAVGMPLPRRCLHGVHHNKGALFQRALSLPRRCLHGVHPHAWKVEAPPLHFASALPARGASRQALQRHPQSFLCLGAACTGCITALHTYRQKVALCLGAACTGCIGKSRQIAAHHFVAYAVSR